MIRKKKIGLIAACTLGASVPAVAADAPIYQPVPPVTVQEFGSGWYLRGDIGYRFTNNLRGFSSNGVPLSGETFEDAMVVGGGFGYKERWFRADITVDYAMQSRYQGNAGAIAPYFTTKLDATTALVNGYIDLGTWHRITPYVGAGVGASIVRAVGLATAFNSIAPHGIVSNFAWAVMAGIGYNVSPNVVIDAGYRFIDVGDAKSGVPQFGPWLALDRIDGHEVRLGFRYMID